MGSFLSREVRLLSLNIQSIQGLFLTFGGVCNTLIAGVGCCQAILEESGPKGNRETEPFIYPAF